MIKALRWLFSVLAVIAVLGFILAPITSFGGIAVVAGSIGLALVCFAVLNYLSDDDKLLAWESKDDEPAE